MSGDNFTIKAKDIGTTHYLASCSVCGWRYEGQDSGKGNTQARRHVARTGHSVSVEKAVVRKYFKEAS